MPQAPKLRASVLSVMTLIAWFISPSGGALAQPSSDFIPVTDAMLQEPAPDDWLMWRRTLNSWGYSPLDQIDRLCEPLLLGQVHEYLGQLGYQDIHVDMEGFRSGSLNQLVTLEAGPVKKYS